MYNNLIYNKNNGRRTVITDKILTLHINIPSEREKICAVGRALSVPDRVRILNLLTARSMNLNEISKVLDIPVSSVSNHINALQDAELVLVSYQPSAKGHVKLCSEMVCMVQIKRATPKTPDNDAYCMEMPVGMYTDCDIKAPCGMASAEKQLFAPDSPEYFFLPERKDAELVWFSHGYVSYMFPYSSPEAKPVSEISFSLELCSEAVYYRNVWPSDITFLINDVEVLTYTCPGDFGGRRGVYTPEFWPVSSSQFGLLKKITVNKSGAYIDDQLVTKDVTISRLGIVAGNAVKFTVLLKDDAKHQGGINIYGKHFGDFPQAIIMMIR